MNKHYFHVLVAVGDETLDVKFPYRKTIMSLDGDTLKFETENTFGDYVTSGLFDVKKIIGYYEDVHTD